LLWPREERNSVNDSMTNCKDLFYEAMVPRLQAKIKALGRQNIIWRELIVSGGGSNGDGNGGIALSGGMYRHYLCRLQAA